MRTCPTVLDDHRSQCSSAYGAHTRRGILLAALLLNACAKRPHTTTAVSIGHSESGVASWYGEPYHGRKAANGEVYDMNGFTAAHRTLPFETWVEVANLKNRKRVQVRITDRGPFVHGRIIDLSRAAAQQIDLIGSGTARVHVKVVRAPSAVRASYYAVQIASFTDRKEAERLRRNYKGSQLMEHGVNWRVLVGKESSVQEATLLAVQLRRDYPDALVVRMEP